MLLLLLLLRGPEREVLQPPRTVAAGHAGEIATLTAELAQLKTLLAQQQAAAAEHRDLLQQLGGGQATSDERPAAAAGNPSPASAGPLADAVKLERAALAGCTAADVPILPLLRSPCPPGMHGYGCKVRWDLNDRFVPEGRRWLAEFNASQRAVVHCQRGFFDAFADRLTRAHWEAEWDAQPFRIAATPPRTIGKMMHQITTANFYQLTSPPGKRLPLRRAPAPGTHYAPMPDPGFRWNVLDYGRGNIFADPLAHGRRCAATHAAWHCLWQRFPHQRAPRAAPPPDSALGVAADELYNLSLRRAASTGLARPSQPPRSPAPILRRRPCPSRAADLRPAARARAADARRAGWSST